SGSRSARPVRAWGRRRRHAKEAAKEEGPPAVRRRDCVRTGRPARPGFAVAAGVRPSGFPSSVLPFRGSETRRRKKDPERASPSFLARELEAPAVGLDRPKSDGEPEAGAPVLA